MARKLWLALVLGASLLVTGGTSFAEREVAPAAALQPEITSQQPTNQPSVVTDSPSQVPGLKLPASFSVRTDEGFVSIKAECKGPVQWLVLTTAQKVKYKEMTDPDKELIVSVPNVACVISVFCYGAPDGKLTKPVRCDINVVDSGTNPVPTPNPGPTPPAPNVTGPLNITVIEDPLKRSVDYTLLTQWLSAKAALQQLGHRPFLLSSKDPQVTNPTNGFDQLIRRYSLPILVIQDQEGKLLGAGPAPKTLDDLKRMLNQGR
jgi:hypothetical protein